MRIANPEYNAEGLQSSADAYHSPLYIVIYLKPFDIADKLIQKGIGVTEVGSQHGTPLKISTHLGHVSIVQDLLDHGACLGNSQNTAVARGNATIVQQIIAAHPESAGQKDKEFGSVLQMASYYVFNDIVQLLPDSNADVPTIFH